MRRIVSAIIAFSMLFSCAFAAVCFRTDDSVCLLDRDGGVIVAAGTYDDIVPVDTDMFAARQGTKYALINREGVRYTEFIYDELKSGGDGYVLIRTGRQWGILEPGGAILHKCAYSRIIPSGTGAFWAFSGSMNDAQGDPMMLLYSDGRIIGTDIRALDAETTYGSGLLRALFPDRNRYGYIDTSGRIAIDAQYEYAGCFSGGIAVIVRNGRYGAIDTDGNTVLEPVYARVEISEAGVLLASDGSGSVGLYDLHGRRIAARSAELAGICGAYAFMTDGASTSVYSANGGRLMSLSPAANLCAGIGDDLIISDGAWGEECVYLRGSTRRYRNIYPLGTAKGAHIYAYMTINTARYSNDLLGEIQYSTDPTSARYGLISRTGKVLIDAQYRSIEYLDDDRFLVRTDDARQMIDSDGHVYYSAMAADEGASSE